jgi:hypothetical protein
MIDNVHSQIRQVAGGTPLPKPESPDKRREAGSDVALQLNFGDLISVAKQAEAVDVDAVRRVRELVNTGRLTAIESIRAAAQNILSTGI